MSELHAVVSDSFDVYRNQAIEKYLLDHVGEGELILYLWRNDHTVVIGRNQDAYGECDIAKLEEEGGHLARRISGGGAVYHDIGNLNFTFISPKGLFDVAKQNRVLLRALQDLGIDAEENGRNDLLVKGRKFSGHAYYKGKKSCFHHGTVMLKVDEEKLSSYLHVSKLKLHAKNVASVRSRVINLQSIIEDLDADRMARALIASFEEVYEAKVTPYHAMEEEEIETLRKEFEDPSWRYGKVSSLPYEKEGRYEWGTVKILYDLRDELITDCVIYTDALDLSLFENIEEELIGKRIEDLKAEENERGDIVRLLKGIL